MPGSFPCTSPQTRREAQADQTGASFDLKLSQVLFSMRLQVCADFIYSGMGTVPLPNGGRLQTWDGVVSGDRLLTMACSDKLLAWNVVGLQGALLRFFPLIPLFSSKVLCSVTG